MNKLLSIIAAGVLTTTIALAQGPGRPSGPPPDPAERIAMRVNMLATRLSLTDAQKAQATTIFTQAQTSSESARESMRTVQSAIRDAVKANNTGVIDQQSITLGTLSGQLAGIEAKAEAAFYAILTADQKAKYDAGHGRGPGGPGMDRFGARGFGGRG